MQGKKKNSEQAPKYGRLVTIMQLMRTLLTVLWVNHGKTKTRSQPPKQLNQCLKVQNMHPVLQIIHQWFHCEVNLQDH